jgi:hypothetical protein
VTTFRDADEVYHYIGGIFEAAIADPDIGPKMKNSGLTMRFEYTEPEAVLFADFPNATVHYGHDVPATEPALQLNMSADDAHRFYLGKLNLVMAIARGAVKVKGPVPEMLKLLPLAKPLFAQYHRLLEAAGRHDLLNA